MENLTEYIKDNLSNIETVKKQLLDYEKFHEKSLQSDPDNDYSSIKLLLINAHLMTLEIFKEVCEEVLKHGNVE